MSSSGSAMCFAQQSHNTYRPIPAMSLHIRLQGYKIDTGSVGDQRGRLLKRDIATSVQRFLCCNAAEPSSALPSPHRRAPSLHSATRSTGLPRRAAGLRTYGTSSRSLQKEGAGTSWNILRNLFNAQAAYCRHHAGSQLSSYRSRQQAQEWQNTWLTCIPRVLPIQVVLLQQNTTASSFTYFD